MTQQELECEEAIFLIGLWNITISESLLLAVFLNQFFETPVFWNFFETLCTVVKY